MHFMRCDTMYVHTHIPSSWEKDQPWTTLSTPTIKVLECLLWTDYVCNNTTGILVGWLGHFVLSLLPSNQDIEGSTEDPDKGLRNRCQLSQERQKPAQGASAVHCLKRLFPEIYFYLKLAAHQSRKRQQSYQWEQLVLVNNEAISPSREQIRGEIINDGEKLSSSYKTARKGPPLLTDLGRCRGWAFLALIKGRKDSGMIWGTQLLPDLRRSQHRQQLYLGLPWWLRRRESANAGDLGSIPGMGRSPGGGHSNHPSTLDWRIPMDRAAWWATVHGVTKSQTQLTLRGKHSTYLGH